MADNFLNKTGLTYYHNKIKNEFADAQDLSDLSDRVDNIVSQGGEPNVIEVVKQNGTALTVTNKSVDVIVPTNTSDLTNDGDGTDSNSPFATQAYVSANGGKIDTIKVNGTTQTITNKSVDITVPTAVSDLTNDSGYQTASDVSTAIGTALSSTFTYKGSVATVNDLPSSGNKTGDVYDVQATGVNYAWNGSSWDALGQIIDTSALWAKSELTAITTAEIDTIVAGS